MTAGQKFITTCGKLLEVLVEQKYHRPKHFIACWPHKDFDIFDHYEVDSDNNITKTYPAMARIARRSE